MTSTTSSEAFRLPATRGETTTRAQDGLSVGESH
jgi:hypothetical protein